MNLWTLKDKNILVVDDFPGMRSMLKTMLTSYGAINITECSNGIEAVEALAENSFDIVLCDYNLGDGKDGQQILEEAKERDLIPYSTVYIMTTAENTSEMVMGAVEYQPDDYLSKPFTKQVLLARLKQLDDRKSSLKPIAQAMKHKDFELAYGLCEKLLAAQPKNRIQILKIQSDIALKMKALDKAEEIFNTVLGERELSWAKLGLAKVRFEQENYDDAKLILEELIKENPSYVFAHDLLALLHRKQGNLGESQKLLQEAISKSPKAILRQKELADVSFLNEDYELSESAYKRVLRIGKHSYYHGPEDYMGLAKTYIKKGSNIEALRSLGNMRKVFRTSGKEKQIKSLVSETILYHELGKHDDAKKSINEIFKEFNKNPSCLAAKDAIELAKICYSLEMTEEGDLLTQHVVRNNHDNQEFLDELISSLGDVNSGSKISELIASTRDEVIALNNRGVELATQGKIEESIELFHKAAAAMAENSIVNLNAAQSLIMYMSKSGADRGKLEEAMGYLDRINVEGKPTEKHHKLLSICRKLQSSLPA